MAGFDMANLVDAIEDEMARCGGKPQDKEALRKIMENFEGREDQFEDYMHVDGSESYTRNLVATDNRSFALILLCWSKGKGSAIHDHPGDGCWMSMLQGGLRETRYCREEGCDELNAVCVKDYSRKDEADGVTCAYIDDSIALHKVENASESEVAVSLHLYSPPPAFCSCWDDHKCAKTFRIGKSGQFHTRFGEKLQTAQDPADEAETHEAEAQQQRATNITDYNSNSCPDLK